MMKYPIIKLAVLGLTLALGIGFWAGCSSMEPYEYKQEADEEMPGPGLLTGEDGEAVIFRIPDKSQDKPDEPQKQSAPEETPKNE